MIQWADGIFNYRFGNGAMPVKITHRKEHVKNSRQRWYRHLFSWLTGGGVLVGIILYLNNHPQTELLFTTFKFWLLILLIDFVISISHSIFPKR